MKRKLPEISELGDLTTPALVGLYTEITGQAPPNTRCRELLLHSIAWEIQAARFGGYSPNVRRKLNHLADLRNAAAKTKVDRKERWLRPGTMLVRSWRGRNYEVQVLESGFAFEGQTFQSLSEIARSITGTRWNGPAFFGLRNDKSRNRMRGDRAAR